MNIMDVLRNCAPWRLTATTSVAAAVALERWERQWKAPFKLTYCLSVDDWREQRSIRELTSFMCSLQAYKEERNHQIGSAFDNALVSLHFA